MKKTLNWILTGMLVLTMGGCSQSKSNGTDIVLILDDTNEEHISDGSYNESIYNGMTEYAALANKNATYVVPEVATKEGYIATIQKQIKEGAKIIICAGDKFDEAVYQAQTDYPDTAFLLVDTIPHDAQYTYEMNSNVHQITFQEEQAGYLAGYATVKDGYTKLGFVGGAEEPAVIRYGTGYVQGAEAAASELGVQVELNYIYNGNYDPNQALYEKVSQWYQDGTEIVFACGGLLYESVFQAAENNNGKTIGVDVDQSMVSDTVITSAEKNVGPMVEQCLKSFFENEETWPRKYAGNISVEGASSNAIGLPTKTASWKFKTFTVAEYDELYAKLKDGTIVVSNSINGLPETEFVQLNTEA